jgi:8-oxo-dGTP pyrophosphatase MutT (NUDIX family)
MRSMPDDPPSQLHLAAYALCVNPGDQLLLARMATGPNTGRWTMPGGGVLPGEHPGRAVLRELQEETGLVCSEPRSVVGVFSVVYERSVFRPWGPVHHVGIVYDFRGIDGELRDEQDGSTDRCGWHSRDEAERLPLVPLGEYGVQLAWGS